MIRCKAYFVLDIKFLENSRILLKGTVGRFSKVPFQISLFGAKEHCSLFIISTHKNRCVMFRMVLIIYLFK